MTDALLVLTTVGDRAAGTALAEALLERRLAACVNVGAPVESLYHWRGRIETGTEVPLIIKTQAALYPKVEAAIRELHAYELPEIIAVPVTHGYAPYIGWLADETRAR
ncbi:MAG TPA: divalent-cation tolerance protein CutA [Casimicrobiaceae bacterium]|nr:divalent-cation tolerance protein CutA [Casimicrobiaceae bacterium]